MKVFTGVVLALLVCHVDAFFGFKRPMRPIVNRDEATSIDLKENALEDWPADLFSQSSYQGSAVSSTQCSRGRCPQIVGGKTTKITEVPHQVALLKFLGIIPMHFCGGTLVQTGGQNPINKVVTAAQCFDPLPFAPVENQKYYVAMGIDNLFTGFLSPNLQLIEVEKVEVHERWTKDFIRNDVAVLTLKKPAMETPFVRPIELAGFFDGFPGADCTISGWGFLNRTTNAQSPLLQSANVTTIRTLSCVVEWWMRLGDMRSMDYSEICTKSDDVAACAGDSGGPMVCNDKLVGIISWGNNLCTFDTSFVYSRVNYFSKWIKKRLSTPAQPPPPPQTTPPPTPPPNPAPIGNGPLGPIFG